MAEVKDYNKIKVVLADKKRTNKDLADYLKVQPATVSRWCTNTSQPSIETLFKIADYLEVPVSTLLAESNQKR